MRYYFHKREVGNVSLFFYTKGERAELATGVKLEGGTLHRTRGYLDETKEAQRINESLFNCLDRANQIVYLFKNANEKMEPSARELKGAYNKKDSPVPTLASMLELYSKAIEDGEVRKRGGHKMSEVSMKNAISSINMLGQKLSKNLLTTPLGSSVIGNQTKAERFGSRIIAELAAAGYEDKSIEAHLNNIKSAMRWHDREYSSSISINARYMHITVKQKSVNTITGEEARYIIKNFDYIYFKKTIFDQECKALQLCLCALLTGQRSEDMQSWTTDNLNGDWLEFRQIKTGTEMRIPVAGRLMELFNSNATTTGKLMPSMNNVSKYLKRVFSRLDIFDYDYSREVYSEGELSYKKGKRWEFITLHEMRGTFITNLLAAGVDEATVKSMSGHTVNSSAFKRYVKMPDESKAAALDSLLRNDACDIAETRVRSINH